MAGEPRLQSSGLVAAYAFGEGSGPTVSDASGLGNNGVISGAAWTAGKFGGGLDFNGTNALVRVNDSPSLALANAMTLEAWVYPARTTSTWKDVIYKGQDDIYYLEGSSSQGGAPAMGGSFSSGALVGTFAPPTNTWTHLAATYDGSSMRLYVNGVQVASRQQTGSIDVSTGELTIGGDVLYGQYWEGRIDEVRIYSRALTASEIQVDMATPIQGSAVDTTPPTVAIVSPSPGALSHVPTITATASDDQAVLSVEFLVNGNSLGTDVSAPYLVSWDTTAQPNGAYVLTAVARDVAGNVTTSDPVSVTVTNPGFVNEVVVPDMPFATTIAFLPDGRMLVGELTETIWVLQPGANRVDATPFLQLNSSQLVGEQGLMDIALDPNFNTNGFYYLFYTRGGSSNRNRISRFTASGNTTVAGSEAVLWEDDAVAELEHHGGSLAFGSDGKLYFTLGDQFDAQNAQRLDTPRGKLLRINPDGAIPSDNPFYDGNGPNADEIWALGLRNAFRLSFDAPSGRMFIADVGGNDASTAFEEVNLAARGANYGWPLCEGACGVAGVTSPIYSYPHVGRDASITGGFVYRGSQFPSEYYGNYFFGDYVQNTISRLKFGTNGQLLAKVNFWPATGAMDTALAGDPVKFIEGPDGALYYIDLGFNDQHVPNPSAIRRIRYLANDQPPLAVADGSPRSGQAPLTVAFSSAGSSDPEGRPLTYNWDFGDGTSSTLPNPTHTYQAAGPYVARLTVADGVNATLATDVQITVGTPPVPSILTPSNGTTFRAGNVIAFSGSAGDAQDGALPASAFSWRILFRHESHIHPGGTFTGVSQGSFTIPTTGHDFQGFTRYEIVLSVTDSTGLVGTTSVTVFPEKVNLTFDTVPSGLVLEFNGISKRTPFVVDDLIGFQDIINAPDQSSGDTQYGFVSWSDGGSRSHGIVVPTSAQSYVARFQSAVPSGLVAAFGFDETTGTTVTDASGNGHVGTLNGATRTTAGKFGGALQFNGTSARVTVTETAALRLTTGMTMSAWVNRAAVSSKWGDIIYKGNDNYYLEGTSPKGLPATGGTFAGRPLFGPSPLPANTWAHLAATYDGATLRLYVNGTQVASRAETAPLATSASPLEIGGDVLNGQNWAGLIDEVRIFNRALSQTEIQAIMNTPVGGAASDTTAPTAPGSLTATVASNSQIDVSWMAATDNIAVTSYLIERQTAGNPTFVQVATTTATTFADSGLSAGTAYTYRVRATDAAGNAGPYSNMAGATTLAADGTPPTAPGNLIATATSSTQISLTWSAATDDVGVTEYLVERRGGASATFAQIGTTSGTAFGDSGLLAATAYSYRVRATDAAAHAGPYSAEASATTPALPGALVAGYGFDETGGTMVTDASGRGHTGTLNGATRTTAGKYGGALQFDGSSARVTVADTAALRLTTGMTLSAWVNPSTAPAAWRDVIYKGNDNYYLEGASSQGPPATGGTFSGGPLYAPGPLAVNTWTYLAVTYDAATVRLYINGTQVASRTVIATIATSTNPLEIGGDGLYGQNWAGLIDEVRIYNRALSAAEIQTDMNTPLNAPPLDTAPPTAPGNLTATTTSPSRITLTWNTASDDVAVTGYLLERRGGGNSNFVQIATTGATAFADSGLLAATTYTYRVRATDAAAHLGPYSAEASATTAAVPTGLVAAYGFDETSGATVADASGRGHTGTLNGATRTTSGRYGGALEFNGTSARVTIADTAALRLTTGMTLSGWVNPSTITAVWRDVIYKGNDNYYLEGASSQGTPATGGTFSGGPLYAPTALAVNTWTHLAVTYDGTTLRLYVNGTQVASRSVTGAMAISTNPLEIGGDAVYGQNWAGLIDEVRIYNRALSAAEIQADMNTPIG